ncbi:Retrovirus-related Pol polyprotein from transposon [Nosema granulosis]|uniref:Retrovirus-related Pol polyprotein from transposon n=1 Tax=Nosema granulosis TaxID=83296 RepID=A0A9P6H048_9MICR|nr:Retrovirus-related Pol polyprotein from transposon [Nosema granulosis]
MGLKLNVKKCEYGKKEIKILRHIITDGCVKVDPEKVRAVKELPIPGSIKKLQSFLGLFNYSSKHIRDSYKFTKGLYAILELKENQEEKVWNNYMNEVEYVEGIVKCKEIMENAATLYIPDLNKKFILITGCVHRWNRGYIITASRRPGENSVFLQRNKQFG